MKKRRKAQPRQIEVASDDYQPTRAELDEPIKLDGAEDMSVDEVVQRLLRPVQMREVPAAEWRKRRGRP